MESLPNIIYDFIIVGSGPGAVMNAQTLVESGYQVLMLDFGNIDSKYSQMPANSDFSDLRKNDVHQFRYFLGDDFESVPSPEVKTGAQLTPARKHIIKNVEEWCPIISDNFFPMESLALGGLGAGWGLGAYVYTDTELEKAGLPVSEMRFAYQIIADRIGISAGNDDLKNEVSLGLIRLQPPLIPDNSVEILLKNYQSKKDWFIKNNIVCGLPSMAMLTEKKNNREANSYNDMDFYSEGNSAAWRPYITVNQLKECPNFHYLPGHFVMKFIENSNSVSVISKKLNDNSEVLFKSKKLILAAGALGSARIALRSLPIDSLPLLCNSYTYMPSLHLKMIGKTFVKKKTSMAQAMMILKPNNEDDNAISVAIYSYQSLLLMRLIQQSPLNIKDNLKIFRWLYPAFIIAGIHHPDYPNQKRIMRLINNDKSKTGDALSVDFEYSETAKAQILKGEKMVKRAFFKLGILPIKQMNPGNGSSIHYGGTLPFSDNELLGRTDVNGKLYGTSNVYSADGASFSFLPAKGITLSIMANAHRVALHLIEVTKSVSKKNKTDER
jgi:hypothetical protein